MSNMSLVCPSCQSRDIEKGENVHTCNSCGAQLVWVPGFGYGVVDVCIAGSPAVNGVCGDPDCVCAMSDNDGVEDDPNFRFEGEDS
jgi:hypothetical protein